MKLFRARDSSSSVRLTSDENIYAGYSKVEQGDCARAQ